MATLLAILLALVIGFGVATVSRPTTTTQQTTTNGDEPVPDKPPGTGN